MSANSQFIGFTLAVIVPFLTLCLSVLISSRRLTDLRKRMDAHFDAFDVRFAVPKRS